MIFGIVWMLLRGLLFGMVGLCWGAYYGALVIGWMFMFMCSLIRGSRRRRLGFPRPPRWAALDAILSDTHSRPASRPRTRAPFQPPWLDMCDEGCGAAARTVWANGRPATCPDCGARFLFIDGGLSILKPPPGAGG